MASQNKGDNCVRSKSVVPKKFFIEEVSCIAYNGKDLSPLRGISAIDLRDRQRNLETTSPFARLIASEPSMDGVSRGEFLVPSSLLIHEKLV